MQDVTINTLQLSKKSMNFVDDNLCTASKTRESSAKAENTSVTVKMSEQTFNTFTVLLANGTQNQMPSHYLVAKQLLQVIS